MRLNGDAIPSGLSKGDRDRATKILEWFKAMASKEEMDATSCSAANPDKGKQRLIALHLQNLIIARCGLLVSESAIHERESTVNVRVETN